jgi:hypothetical protein
MHVYVTRILDPALIHGGHFQPEQVELLAWGVLFPTIEEAEELAENYR